MAAIKEETYLSLKDLESLELIDDVLVWRSEDNIWRKVEAQCAMPLSRPNQYVVLREPKPEEGGEPYEIGIIESLEVLKPNIRDAVLKQLELRYFLPQITRINKVTERFGSAIWDIDTDRGHIVISTRQLNEAVRELGDHRFLIIDVDGNRYEIHDLNNLPPESRRHFAGR